MFCKLEEVEKELEEYKRSDYVFRNSGSYLIVYERIKGVTKTNEGREVVDHNYALYRANKLRIVKIVNLHDLSENPSEIIVDTDDSTGILKLSVGLVRELEEFDADIDIVRKDYSGFYYYKSVAAAYYASMYDTYDADGYLIEYDDDGCKVGEGYYLENGDADGKFITYYENGNIKKITNYLNGDAHGDKIKYYESGSIKSQSYYLQDKKHGKFTGYHLNGSKKYEGDYEDGMRQGTWTFYNPDGSIKSEVNYVNDQKEGKFVVFDKNGDKLMEGSFVNNVKHGKWTYYNGYEIISRGNYVNDVVEGHWTVNYKNGRSLYDKSNYKIDIDNEFESDNESESNDE